MNAYSSGEKDRGKNQAKPKHPLSQERVADFPRLNDHTYPSVGEGQPLIGHVDINMWLLQREDRQDI